MSDDRLIDDVAREMTDGQPSPDFRARVVAGIVERREPRRRWRAAWIISPIVVATAAIVMTIVVGRPVPPSRNATARPETVSQEPATMSKSSAPTVRLKEVSASLTGGRASRAGRAASGIDALAPPPLEVPALEITSLTAEAIAVAPMETIDPIPVTPLPTEEARQDSR